MTPRVTVTALLLCAVAWIVAASAAGCGASGLPAAPAPPPAHSSAPAAKDAGMASTGFAPRCPRDAVWNGRVCVGHGYVVCPTGSHLDREVHCSGPLPPPAPPSSAKAEPRLREKEEDED